MMSRVQRVTKGKMSNGSPSALFLSLFTSLLLCLLNTSTKSFRIEKWKAGVRSLRRERHLLPRDEEDELKIMAKQAVHN